MTLASSAQSLPLNPHLFHHVTPRAALRVKTPTRRLDPHPHLPPPFIRSTTQDIRVRATLVLDFGRIIARKTDPVLRAMIWRANEMQYVHVIRICETLYLGMEFWNWAR